MKGLADKVAIVAGAGARGDGIGNGRAAALLLAEAGCRVLAVDRDIALAERTVAMIQDAGGVAQAARANVTKLSDCEAVVAQACAAFGGVDLLDNNVGIGSTGTVVTEDPARGIP